MTTLRIDCHFSAGFHAQFGDLAILIAQPKRPSSCITLDVLPGRRQFKHWTDIIFQAATRPQVRPLSGLAGFPSAQVKVSSNLSQDHSYDHAVRFEFGSLATVVAGIVADAYARRSAG